MEPESFPENEHAKSTASPPYISFLSFINCLEWLKTERVPHRFDRSFWSRKYSGGVGSQLLIALRFLGLLHNAVPQPALEELVNANEAERKRLLAGILKNSYKEVDFNLLERATPGMIREWMSKYPTIQGATQQKAISFLINALKYVGIPLPPGLEKSARNRPTSATSASTSRTAKKPKQPADVPKTTKPDEEKPGMREDNSPTTVREIKLNSGGEVSLKIKVNLFDLSEDDREFIMGLVDAFRDYPTNFNDDNEEEDEA